MRLSGYYIYYSPMLLGIKSKKKLDLHNGTTFDYFLNMKLKDKGLQARYKILSYYIEGLLKIISEIESGKISSELSIEGTSYFFSDNTAVKLGFKLQKPLFYYYFNFILNFVDLCFMYSYSKGKFTIPRIFNIKRAVISPAELCAQKENLKSLLKLLTAGLKILDPITCTFHFPHFPNVRYFKILAFSLSVRLARFCISSSSCSHLLLENFSGK